MKREISDRYEPKSVEKKWMDFWEKNQSFKPDGNGDPFAIVIPPPNVTGHLHIGHALDHTLQDIIIRIERKKGKDTVWVPGVDHAGIATQVVVEKELVKEGTKRTDFTREEFQERVWIWKEQSGGSITRQQRLLGESVDWSRERFTMDAGFSQAVLKVFKSLYDEGLIYRGERIINWCPVTKTAISDIEVEHKEVKGKLYHIRYPFKNRKGYVVVATTRPETMLGDVAVCANPADERYLGLEREMLILPLVDREIPLLYDNFVDKEFGTGLVKITPAHDPNDFEAGLRLELQPINILNPDATLNDKTGKYAGLDRFVARKKIIEDLGKLDLIEKIEDHIHQVGHNTRGGAVIEPILSKQWFVKIKPLAGPAIEAVRSGKIKFIPPMWEKTYFEWMENIRDWCISRQLWWGHRIPAWYCQECEHMEVATEPVLSCSECSSTNVKQDEDVLDTWFSSGLWPFGVFGWPEKTEDLKKYYPNAVLVTGFDIIFFWVARMIMFGIKIMDDVPFKKIIIHGLVRDEHGKKFSKSLGNVIDPLVIMEKYGTDAVRFFLAITLPEGRDMLFDESRLDGYRSFCNKVWNSSRFILMNLPENFSTGEVIDPEAADLWIMNRFNHCLERYELAYTEYRFYEMANIIYDFIWADFCDWYLELVKFRIYGKSTPESAESARQTLSNVLISALNLLHPFMPFITEEVHSAFNNEIMTRSPWPSKFKFSAQENKIKEINLLKEIVTQVRIVRADLSVAPDKKCSVILKSNDSVVSDCVKSHSPAIMQLAKAESLNLNNNYTPVKTDSISSFSAGEIILPLSGLIDFAKEKTRLLKEKDEILAEKDKINKKLDNPGFLEKAKPEVVNKEKEKLNVLGEKLSVIEKGLEKLK